MGWRFRKSFSPLPAVRVNFSPRGISTSVGVGPVRLHLGSRGAAATTRIPGTGISFRETISVLAPAAQPKDAISPPALSEREPSPALPSAVAVSPIGEIRSSSTVGLTTSGLAPLKELVARAQTERATLLPELDAARAGANRTTKRYEAWRDGWLLRRLLRSRFANLAQEAEEAVARVAELEEQERLSRLATEFDLPESLKEPFGRLCDATAALAQSQRIWDTLARVATDRLRERTTADQAMTRTPVAMGLGSCDLIQLPWTVPHLRNANGGDVFIYPGFVLYHISAEAFALVEVGEVLITYAGVSFIEEEGVPADSVVIGQTWKKANKNGSPDKRFANNYQIPVVRYGSLRISSKGGLNEEYLISKAAAAERLATEWKGFQEAFFAATT